MAAVVFPPVSGGCGGAAAGGPSARGVSLVLAAGPSLPGQFGAAGGIRTPDPRFRRHIPQSTTRGFIRKYTAFHFQHVRPCSLVFDTISTTISTSVISELRTINTFRRPEISSQGMCSRHGQIEGSSARRSGLLSMWWFSPVNNSRPRWVHQLVIQTSER